MLKHVYLLLLSTFTIGFISGFWAFFVIGEPRSAPDNPEPAEGFEIIAEAYGGCDMLGRCPAYRVQSDGDYTYVVERRGAEGDQYRDRLSSTRLEELELLVGATDFEKVIESEFGGTCPIAFDGLAYEYRIQVDGMWYEVNTCIEDVSGQALFVILEDYFEIFGATHQTP